jgi:RHS repeat-associated protein
VIEQEAATGSVTRSFVYGIDLLSSSDASKTTGYLVDGLGSTRAAVDSSGVIQGSVNYDAYGRLLTTMSEVIGDYLFTGEALDTDTGLYYLRARYYHPSNGTLLSIDPISGDLKSPLTLHDYIYAIQNPVIYIDPSGNSATLESALFTGLVSFNLSLLASEIGLLFYTPSGPGSTPPDPRGILADAAIAGVTGASLGGIDLVAQPNNALKAVGGVILKNLLPKPWYNN